MKLLIQQNTIMEARGWGKVRKEDLILYLR